MNTTTMIRRNFESDFTFLEQFGIYNKAGTFVPTTIPDDADFVLEFWADEGKRFRASRIGGVYDHCEKVDETNLRVYIPLSRIHLGKGRLCKALRISYPENFYNREDERICVPAYTDILLWDGPSDNVEITTGAETVLAPTIRGRDGLSANYYLQAVKINPKNGAPYQLRTILEGITDDDLAQMADPSHYRLVLMRFRKHKSEGRRWRIPMLPYEHAKRITGKVVKSAIAESDTWWAVTDRNVEWWGGQRRLEDILSLGTTLQQNNRQCFRNVRNVKMRIGVALFKQTGQGGEGWTRMSNIAEVELFLPTSGNGFLINIK